MRVAIAVVLLLTSSTPAVTASAQTTIVVVRHADRESSPSADPPLTIAGMKRAQDLAAALRDAGVRAIITTQFRRTQATAEPLAHALGIVPEVTPDLGVSHAEAVAHAILEHHAGETVLVVGHGHTVPAIVAALGAPRPPPICETVYDEMFIVTVRARGRPTVLSVRYGAPSERGPGCTAR